MDAEKYFYYYEPEDKFYRYKKPISKHSNHDLNGNLLIPGHATTVIPPDEVPKGYIPVFDEQHQKWEIKKDDFWHYEITDCPNHFSDFPINQLPQLYSFSTHGSMEKDTSIRLNNVFTGIPNISNGFLFMIRFISRINIINKKIAELYQKHQEWLKPNMFHSLDDLIEYKLMGEDIIHLLKKLLDEFITAIYIHDNYEEVKATHKIEIDDYGKALFAQTDPPIVTNLKVAIEFGKYKPFLETVKELDNGFKHNLTPAESDSQIGIPVPTIVLYRYKRSSLQSLTKYNVYVGGLIDQCNKFMYEYLKKNSGS